MRYSHSKFRTELPVTALRREILAAARRDAENSMSKKRFVATFISLMLGAVLMYSSVFYVPAYLDSRGLMGISTQDSKFPKMAEEPGTVNTFKNILKMRRSYLYEGQGIVLNYNMSGRAAINAVIGQCEAPPIIEVFHCRKTNEQRFKIVTGAQGRKSFAIKKTGFYYFDDFVTNTDGSPTDITYHIEWTRDPIAQIEPPAFAQTDEKKPALRLRRSN